MSHLEQRSIIRTIFSISGLVIFRSEKITTPVSDSYPRKNIRNFYGGIGIGPRPENSPLMQVKSGVRYIFFSDLKNGGLETASINLNWCDLIFLSGDDISFSSEYQFESLKEDFNILQDYVIPAGDYNFWRHTLSLTSAKRRNLWVATRIGFGTFYSGKRKDLSYPGRV